ncbi:hypothetical protein PR048_029444 [Dryococelus australis]|uniref:Uncharacterized protein n=1 Tax=Dryococelus australis TaxID=614101 RepID=A0ABQ9GE21_9NEOP|nr:hypothetical protein PR048_029444 [Dryococelus australis]
MVKRRNARLGKLEILEETHRPAACENPGVDPARNGTRFALVSSAGLKGREKREIPEKTRRPAASSGTIPTRENPGVARPGIEGGEQSNRSATVAPASAKF